MLDKESVREVAVKYAEKVKAELNPNAVILFGSYVNGEPHEWSDIDVAVVVNDFDGDWLKTCSRLYHLTWDFDEIIEPHLLDETCDKSGFLEHVIETGECIYKRSS